MNFIQSNTKTKISLKIKITLFILPVLSLFMVLTEDKDDSYYLNQLEVMDYRFDYYYNFTKRELDNFCDFIKLIKNKTLLNNLRNKDICDCPQYKIGEKPEWINLRNYFTYKENYKTYLEKLGFKIDLKEHDLKYFIKKDGKKVLYYFPYKSIKLNHISSNEEIRIDLFHEDVKNYQYRIFDKETGKITIQNFDSNSNLNDIKQHIDKLRKEYKNILKEEKNWSKYKTKILEQEVYERIQSIEVLQEFINRTLQHRKNKIESDLKMLNLKENLDFHYHRIIEKEMGIYKNQCGDKNNLTQKDPGHQIRE